MFCSALWCTSTRTVISSGEMAAPLNPEGQKQGLVAQQSKVSAGPWEDGVSDTVQLTDAANTAQRPTRFTLLLPDVGRRQDDDNLIKQLTSQECTRTYMMTWKANETAAIALQNPTTTTSKHLVRQSCRSARSCFREPRHVGSPRRRFLASRPVETGAYMANC